MTTKCISYVVFARIKSQLFLSWNCNVNSFTSGAGLQLPPVCMRVSQNVRELQDLQTTTPPKQLDGLR